VRSIKEHLQENQCSYKHHFLFAVKAGILMIFGGFASLIHAVLPCVFEGTSAKIVSSLYNGRIKNHPNKKYRSL
jgi:hypothetical protein